MLLRTNNLLVSKVSPNHKIKAPYTVPDTTELRKDDLQKPLYVGSEEIINNYTTAINLNYYVLVMAALILKSHAFKAGFINIRSF